MHTVKQLYPPMNTRFVLYRNSPRPMFTGVSSDSLYPPMNTRFVLYRFLCLPSRQVAPMTPGSTHDTCTVSTHAPTLYPPMTHRTYILPFQGEKYIVHTHRPRLGHPPIGGPSRQSVLSGTGLRHANHQGNDDQTRNSRNSRTTEHCPNDPQCEGNPATCESCIEWHNAGRTQNGGTQP
jgi:hypothetical protein